ncbi:MAG: metalloregulator ArsR/SmtB family transcription factor [Chloroflexota bacterium]
MVINTLIPKSSTKPIVIVHLSPALNVLNSFNLMKNIKTNPGLDDWITITFNDLSREWQNKVMLVTWAGGVEVFSRFIKPNDDFDMLIKKLKALEPVVIRDQVIRYQIQPTYRSLTTDYSVSPDIDPGKLLNDVEHFIDFYQNLYELDSTNSLLIDELHMLLNNPHALKQLMIETIVYLWENFGRDEWENQQSSLVKTVVASREYNLMKYPLEDAMKLIIGRDLTSLLDFESLKTFNRIRLIPSPHSGPYITLFGHSEELNIAFGNRLPSLEVNHLESLDTKTLLNRLKALADSTRLNILIALTTSNELSTQEIMEIFNLNKSAASRHLRNLHASGLIVERRDDMNRAKFYSLNHQTFGALGTAFLRFATVNDKNLNF